MAGSDRITDRYVSAVVAAVRAAVRTKERSPSGRVPRQATVAIHGERGIGKSTVLWAACDELRSAGDLLVLDVIRPELMPPGDSLEGRLIEALYQWHRTNSPELLDARSSPKAKTLGSTLEELALREAGSRSLPLGLLTGQRSERSAALGATRDSFATERNLHEVIAEILRLNGKTQLIVPIDDPDASPDHITDMLSSIRLLDEMEVVTCVVAVELGDFRRQIAANLARQYGLAVEDGSVLRAADRQVEKAFPRWNRIDLMPWSPTECLNFAPIEGTGPMSGSLRSVLARHVVKGDGKPERLLDLFVPWEGPRNAFFMDALPRRPRLLDSLFRDLRKAPTSRALRTLLGYLVDQLGEESAALRIETPRLVESEEGRLVLDIETAHWSYFTRSNHIMALGHPRLDDRPAVRLRIQVDTTSVARLGIGEDAPPVPSHALATVQVLRRCLADGLVDPGLVRGLAETEGGLNFSRVEVYVDGGETDNQYFVPPRWQASNDVFALDAFLGSLGDEMLQTHRFEQNPVAVEFFTLAFVAAVVNIQRGRQPTGYASLQPLSAASVGSTLRHWSQVRDELAQAVMRAAKTQYRACLADPRSQRDSNYIIWFEERLPQILVSTFLPGTLVSKAQRQWKSAVGAARREDEAQAALGNRIASRLASRKMGPWRDDLISLMHALDVEMAEADALDHQRRSGSQRDGESPLGGATEDTVEVPTDARGEALAAQDIDVAEDKMRAAVHRASQEFLGPDLDLSGFDLPSRVARYFISVIEAFGELDAEVWDRFANRIGRAD